MSVAEAPAGASRRTIAISHVIFTDTSGYPRFTQPGDDVDLPPAEERRLEQAGALLPNRPPAMGMPSAVRPGASDMIELAKLAVTRGDRALAQRVLDAERLGGERETRREVTAEIVRLLELTA